MLLCALAANIRTYARYVCKAELKHKQKQQASHEISPILGPTAVKHPRADLSQRNVQMQLRLPCLLLR